MEIPLITDEFTWNGTWFLPNSDKRISATLKYSPTEGVRLNVVGALGDNDEYVQSILYNNKTIYEPVILGRTLQCGCVTLLGCIAVHSSICTNLDIPIVEYKCRCILCGKQHYVCMSDSPILNTVRIQMPMLTEWSPSNVIQHRFGLGEISFSVDANNLEQIENTVSLNDDVQVELLRCVNIHCTQTDIILKQNTQVEFVFNNGASIADVNKYVELFTQFISFSALKLAQITQLTLSSMEKPNDKIYYYPTNLMHNITSYRKHTSFLFTYNDLENKLSQNFAHILQVWYNVDDEIAPIREHLIESIIDKPYFNNWDFLMLAQAIDGYHCRFVNGSNKIGYKKRIEDLLGRFKDVQMLNNSKLNPTIVCNSRNYYSHFFMPKKGQEIYSGKKLYEQTIELRKLLVCCILNLIGFNNSDIDIMLSRCTFYSNLS